VIKDQPGDSYYVRAMFDRLPETNDTSQLTFQKDDILYIDNTMYNGVPGHWSAWLVDNEGNRTRWGIIPSKYKVNIAAIIIFFYLRFLLFVLNINFNGTCPDEPIFVYRYLHHLKMLT
jgi:hypothetical protein